MTSVNPAFKIHFSISFKRLYISTQFLQPMITERRTLIQSLGRYVHPGDWMFTGKAESQSIGDDIFIDECTVLSIPLKWSCVILNYFARKLLCGELAQLDLLSFVLWCFIFEKIKINLRTVIQAAATTFVEHFSTFQVFLLTRLWSY